MGNTQSSPSSTSIDTPTTYPITKKITSSSSSSSSTKSLKRPQPYVGSFFDGQMAVTPPHKQVTKPNRPAGHVNFFEVAALTQQPARSVKSNSSSKSSSMKTTSSTAKKSASSSVYPNSSSGSTTKKYSESIAPSIATTAVADQVKDLSIKEKLAPDFTIVSNRKYWKGKGSQNFMLPCDEDELDRTTTLHYILKATFHGSFTAPVNKILENKHAKVLDIGCGSGTWILEMASEFPNAEFYGVDDCPLFPKQIKPGNSHFKLHNVNTGLPFPDNEFDYVYMRSMIYYFTPEELSQLLSEIARVMKPGGYFEIVDTNYTIRRAGPLSNKLVNNDLKQTIYSASTNMAFASSQHESNINHPIFNFLMLAPQHPSASFIASFIDICQEHATLPIGSWEGGQLGRLHSLNFELFLSSIQCKEPSSSPFTKQSLVSIMDECERYKSYLDWFSCYARKPPLENEQIEQSTLDSIYEFVEGFVDV